MVAKMSGMFTCDLASCGAETPCEWGDLNIGRVFQCPACKKVFAHVTPKGGGRAWIRVSPADVKFHRLIAAQETSNASALAASQSDGIDATRDD